MKKKSVKRRSIPQKGFTLIELLVLIAIIVVIAGLMAPEFLKSQKKSPMIDAVNNAKQIGLFLTDFENEYSSYPDDKTRGVDSLLSAAPSGDSSNAYLAQLFYAGHANSEEIFFVKGGAKRNKKPDNIYGPSHPSKTLEAGECGFAYIMINSNQGERGLTIKDKASTPVLATPMNSTKTFDADVFGGTAVILQLDGSAKTEKISVQTSEVKRNKQSIFAVGEDTVWGAYGSPVVKLPK